MVAMTMAVPASDAAVVFTADQCRVLRQAGVDVTDICPPAKPRKKKS